MEWVQVYDPLNSPVLSTLLAAAPIVVLLGLLVSGLHAHWAAVAGLAVAVASSIWGFDMPASATMASAGFGACYGMLPIGWIVVAAVFLFHLTVHAGHFEIITRSVRARLSPDRRTGAAADRFFVWVGRGRGRGLRYTGRNFRRSVDRSWILRSGVPPDCCRWPTRRPWRPVRWAIPINKLQSLRTSSG